MYDGCICRYICSGMIVMSHVSGQVSALFVHTSQRPSCGMPLSSSPLFRKSFLLLHKNKHIPYPQEMKMKNALSATAVSLCYLFSSSSLVQADKPITTGAASPDAHDEVLATTTKDAKSYFLHKSVIIPHDDKKHRGGEDAAATSDQWLVGE
jgi:hypothetical protein